MNSLKIISEKISEFFLIIVVGIAESWDAFATFRSKISFSISFLEIVLNENDVFGDLSRIAVMLGWFLYFVIRFSNGSSDLALFTDKSSYFGIFNLASTREKIVENLRNFFIIAEDYITNSESQRPLKSEKIFTKHERKKRDDIRTKFWKFSTAHPPH